jgi:S1-C subfamily serine protease
VRVAAAAALAAALAVLGAACGPKARPDYPPPEDDEPMLSETPPEPAAETPATPPGVRVSSGRLARAQVTAVLDRGPGAFLSGLEIEPTFRGNVFAGWMILAFQPNDPAYAHVDLVPGDVVTKINGRTIERPEQLQELWDSLRTATRLDVDYLRNGQPRALRYTIE